MNTTTTEADQIRAEAAALPELPTIYANGMIHAQSWTPNRAERAAISARVAFLKKWLGPELARVTLTVKDHQGAHIGGLTFTN